MSARFRFGQGFKLFNSMMDNRYRLRVGAVVFYKRVFECVFVDYGMRGVSRKRPEENAKGQAHEDGRKAGIVFAHKSARDAFLRDYAVQGNNGGGETICFFDKKTQQDRGRDTAVEGQLLLNMNDIGAEIFQFPDYLSSEPRLAVKTAHNLNSAIIVSFRRAGGCGVLRQHNKRIVCVFRESLREIFCIARDAAHLDVPDARFGIEGYIHDAHSERYLSACVKWSNFIEMKKREDCMHTYGIIVIGGGHAGLEAAAAAARILQQEEADARVALITPDSKALGRMSCNPAVGGTAKGHLVREIDALGGMIGYVCDRVALQMRTLNLSKGAAVHATRAQADRLRYEQEASRCMAALPGLEIIEDRAETILADGDPAERLSVRGVRLASGRELESRFVIVATGTFLNGVLYNGLKTRVGGRYGEAASTGISESLRALGLTVSRLATSTPPRLVRASVDLDALETQYGDPATRPFSRRTPRAEFPYLPQLPCFIAWTNPATHRIIRDALDRAPQYTGDITGPSPKYCPAIEDKIVRFPERERHQLFLEPEGAESDLIYVNGFPTALPEEVQEAALLTVRGLENIRVARFGYGIEYDFVPANQLAHSLETKRVRGLYLAGQINGTSGYEEAASQGIMAGINAARAYRGQEPVILGRHEAYIGVLIDDLISKAPLEPYRMFTSRAEFRLLLREDTVDRRLLRYGHAIGLISGAEWEEEIAFEKRLAAAIEALRRAHLTPEKANIHLRNAGLPETAQPLSLARLALRENLPLGDLLRDIDPARWPALQPEECDARVREAALIELRYEGYIAREREDAARFLKMEEKRIPEGIAYSSMRALSAEAREVLDRIRPRTLGQAARLAGVRAADLSILMLSMRAPRHERKAQ